MEMKTFISSLKPEKGKVYMLCGLAGAGKTTLAMEMAERGFTRLSIDEYIWKHYGRFGLDYPAEDYPKLQQAAETALRQELTGYLEQKVPVVIDYSFWDRKRRDAYKTLIHEHGAQSQLLYLKIDPEVVRARLKVRSARFDANAAFPITDDILSFYLNAFEEPSGEDEIVVTQ